jgi:hypothetical protein
MLWTLLRTCLSKYGNNLTKQTAVRAVRTTCLWFILIIAVFLFYLQLLLIGRLLKNTSPPPGPSSLNRFAAILLQGWQEKNVLFVHFPFQGTGSRDELVNWNLVDMYG